jgi:hypothetical protein
MTKHDAQVIAGGAYCVGYLHGRRSAKMEYKSCTYWPLMIDAVVAAYCWTLRLISYRYPDACESAERLCGDLQ